MGSVRAAGQASHTRLVVTSNATGRAPSCGGCARRESVLTGAMHLDQYTDAVKRVGYVQSFVLAMVIFALLYVCIRSLVGTPCYQRYTEVLLTLVYTILYLIASPVAIMCNKILMKDHGFGYPVMVSALGQTTTAICAFGVVHLTGMSIENGKRVSWRNLMLLGGASALALVLGQYPYLYLTVAFIQMLKAFSPAYMVLFLSCLNVEHPSLRVKACILGLSLCTCVASAGEVNFNMIGVAFMAAASCSDALRLVVAQKLLRNLKLQPMEMLYYMSPVCLIWMTPFALFQELPIALKQNSFALVFKHPGLFIGAGFSGFFVNVTSFLLVKRTSSMTLKLLTMTRNGGLVLASAIIFGETITPLEGLGYGGLVICFGLYTWVKANEGGAKQVIPKEDKAEVLSEKLVSHGEKDSLTATDGNSSTESDDKDGR